MKVARQGRSDAAQEAPKEQSKWLICVSTKLGKAVVRNRLRRILRESLRLLVKQRVVKKGCLIALFPKHAFLQLDHLERYALVLRLCKKAHLL